MNFLREKYNLVRQRTRRVSTSSRVAVVHWDHDTLDYFVVGPKSTQLAVRDRGRLSWAGFANPLLALSAHWRAEADRPQRLVVLLSRPLLEQLSFTLPPAEANELPALVAAEVEQRLGDGDTPPLVDYDVQPGPSSAAEASGPQVLAFALAAAELDRIRDWSQQAGLQLAGISSRELAPLSILRRKHVAEQSLNISVHLVSGEAELAICHGTAPIFLRLIRISTDDPQRVAEQVWMETQRCLTVLPVELAELPQAWFVFTSCDAAWHLARTLEDRGVTVQPVDPLFGWQAAAGTTLPTTGGDALGLVAPTDSEGQAKASEEHTTAAGVAEVSAPVSSNLPVPEVTEGDPENAPEINANDASTPVPTVHLTPQISAATAGAAWEFLHGELRVNLLAPKRTPAPPNPLHRWGAIAVALAGVAVLGVYFLLSDISQLRMEVSQLQRGVAEERKLAAKFQEKADQVAYVESWLGDQVNWLAELNELSERVPNGEQATVRRLTASAAGQMARIDLSLQVAEQAHIAQLENRIRSAKYQATSQRISQNPDSDEYPWQFETQVSFPVEPPQREAYVAVGPDASTPAAALPRQSDPVEQEMP